MTKEIHFEIENNPFIQRKQDDMTVLLKATVILGSPKAGCSGVGICRLLASGSGELYRCPTYPVEVVCFGANQMKIIFEKAQMSRIVLEKYFNGGVFRVEDDFIIPRDIAGKLDLKKRIIRPGVYPVYETTGYLTVVFTTF